MHDAIKPIQVPANFDAEASLQDQVIFVLAYLGSADEKEVLNELTSRNAGEKRANNNEEISSLLKNLYDSGLINGKEVGDSIRYDLSKMTRPHTGKVDPDNLDIG